MAERQETQADQRPEYLVSAVLRVSDEALNPGPLLAKHGLQSDRVWHRGSPDRHGGTLGTSGFNVSVAKATSTAAIWEAVHAFLMSQGSLLREIRATVGACELDFGVMVAGRMVSFHLEPGLVELLAAEGIAVHVTAYPCADDE